MFQIQSCPQVERVSQQFSFKLSEFTEQSLQAFEKTLNRAFDAGQVLFPIFIQSDGGSVAILSGFLSNIKNFREKGVKFVGVVSGTAASAGAMTFFYCDYRYMGEFASLMYHFALCGVSGTMPNVKSDIDWYSKENEKLNEVLSKHLKKPKDWLSKQIKKNGADDWNISPEDALKLGLIDAIKIPQFNLQISAQYSIS